MEEVLTKKKTIVPQLRFPEFEDFWKEVRLGKICSTFKSGSTITSKDISTIGQYPVYGGNGLRGFTDTFTHSGLYLLIGRQGALCGNINVVDGESYISEHAIAVASNNLADTKWLAQRLFHLNLNRLSESSAQPGLSAQKLERLKLRIPSLSEQQKIAAFLSSVDKKLELLERKKASLEAYKKGVMQKIFSREIRFKNGAGKEYPEWEVKKFNQVFLRKTVKNRDNSISLVFSNSAVQGIVLQNDFFNHQVANSNNLEGYYVVGNNDFVYNPRISNPAPVGPMKRNKLGTGVMSPLYTILSCKEGDLTFFEYYFETSFWHKYMKGIANFGVRHDRMNITTEDFMKMPIPYPLLEEQGKIAAFLRGIDSKKEMLEKQLAQTREFKKGLLQQLFV